MREAWGWHWLERAWLDVRYAVRMWTKSPGFSAIAILTIAAGIASSTAIIGQINAVFWRPLPVAQPEALRLVAWTSPRHGFVVGPNVFPGPSIGGLETFGSFSYPAYVAMRDHTRAFSDLACWDELGESRPVVLGERGFASVQFVSGNYFRTLGVRAVVGRTIQPDDDGPAGSSPVAMISHRFWMRAFGGDPHVTRQTMTLNGRPFAVVGVMPEGFFGVDPSVSPDVVVPMSAIQIAAATTNPLKNPQLWNLCRVVGRLLPGVSDEQARIDLERWVAQAIAAQPPNEPYDPPRLWIVDGSRGLHTLRDATSTPLLVLLAVVGGLLLAACANIAGLLVARGSARERELATRMALGAPRGRVVRQLVTESLVLSCAGGAVGLVAAHLLAGFAPNLLSQFMPTLFGADRTLSLSASIDRRVLLFGLGATLVSGVLFGAMPALRATRVDLIRIIRQGNSGGGARVFRITAGQAMVVVEAALAMLLLVGAGLFLRTLTNLRSEDLGLNPDGVLYARVEPRSGAMPQEQRLQFFEAAVKRLQSLPGVVVASASSIAPMGGSSNVGVRVDVQPVCIADASGIYQRRLSSVNSVLPGYFDTLGMRVLSGRDFTWDENQPRRLSVIVNETFARRYLAGRDAVGQNVRAGLDCERRFTDFTVVGVVTDSRSLRAAAEPALYYPLRGYPGPVTLMVRAAQNPAAMISTVRRAIAELNAKIPTFSEATLVDLRERQLRQERLLSNLLMFFGIATLLVCCLGIYGMLSYAVARRRAEISIRMAIGARAPDIVRMVVRESLVPVAIGMAIGGAAAVATARWVKSLLFGISGADPLIIAAATAVLLVVAMAAAALPARAAARVDPVLALRQ